jgi:hypothetical protein
MSMLSMWKVCSLGENCFDRIRWNVLLKNNLIIYLGRKIHFLKIKWLLWNV